MTINGNFERFDYFDLETDFLENFLVESIKIENAWFSYKTAIPEVNVKTNHPRPQSNLKKITLAPHDFAGNFYLISFVNVKQLKLIYAMPWLSIMADLSGKENTE